MNVSTLLDELKVAILAGTTNVDVFEVIPDQVNPPAAILAVAGGNYHDTFDGSMTVQFQVLLIASRANARAGQDAVHAYLPPDQIVDAIEDGTYTESQVKVVGFDALSTVEIANTSYYAVSFQVEAFD